MRTTVVCGLLGSGKTTFIKNRVQGSAEKTVVLVNDFGAAGIDGEIFSAGGIESVELPSGCVCCTLKFDLITTISKVVRQFSPEHLMIEPSGVASPSGVLEALEEAGIGNVSVIGIVDVTEFNELYESGVYGSFFEDQIVNSDVIFVNKTDLAEEEKIVEAMLLIESINPRAILLRSVNSDSGQLPSTDQAEKSNREQRLSDIFHPLPFGERTGVGEKGSHTHFHFETLSFKLSREAELAEFSLFFDDLANGRYGAVARAKALVNTDQGSYRWDLVFGKVDAIPFERNVNDARIVVIGQSLDGQGLWQAVKRISH